MADKKGTKGQNWREAQRNPELSADERRLTQMKHFKQEHTEATEMATEGELTTKNTAQWSRNQRN
jgi:hypothetical protein